MDKAAEVASNMNLDALKEPRGFIKLLEFILAIFAFATTTSHSTESTFVVKGCSEGPRTVQVPFGYHYSLSSGEASFTCNRTTVSAVPWGNFSAPSQFYVFVGVMAFLYSIAAVVLYVWFDDKYRKFDQIPIADFIVSAVFTLLWLISSSAWAQGVTNVKYYTDPEEMFAAGHVETCGPDGKFECETTSTGNFASLHVSIIFGFLNMCVWGGNLWFLFKETKWFKVQSAPVESPTVAEQQPQRV